jgi:hypothetical protein
MVARIKPSREIRAANQKRISNPRIILSKLKPHLSSRAQRIAANSFFLTDEQLDAINEELRICHRPSLLPVAVKGIAKLIERLFERIVPREKNLLKIIKQHVPTS